MSPSEARARAKRWMDRVLDITDAELAYENSTAKPVPPPDNEPEPDEECEACA